ncbi:Haloacid dehalogenase-like hydrolase domain-containing protein 2 [Syncephalis fuscata]|nr:Haloacid dehalogenase-like hydrolase domain-containing protein 2 [Syncephalis fuscata]
MLHGLLIDLSGTLHVGDHAIAGAIEAVERLRASGIPFRFCTNTTKESATSLVQRLQRLGFTVAPHEVFTSLNAAAALMRTQKLNPLTLLEEEAATSIPHDDRQPKDAVLVGLAPSQFHYNKLNKAFHLIQQGCPLFAIHKARYYATESNLALGPGPFVAALEYATNVKATVIGKPERTFFEMALHDMGLPSASTYPPVAIIGDDVEQDLGGLHFSVNYDNCCNYLSVFIFRWCH